MNKKPLIGILALQGAFEEHQKKLSEIGVKSILIRTLSDFTNLYKSGQLSGLIIPGGESTTISKLLLDLEMHNTIKQAIIEGLPTLGTCAGMILLGKTDDKNVKSFEVIDAKTKRNAYGRQLGSFKTFDKFTFNNDITKEIEMIFIRAPYATEVGNDVKTLASVDGKIVAISQKNILALAFHPELSSQNDMHNYFIQNFVISK